MRLKMRKAVNDFFIRYRPAVFEVESKLIHSIKKGASRRDRYAKPAVIVIEQTYMCRNTDS